MISQNKKPPDISCPTAFSVLYRAMAVELQLRSAAVEYRFAVGQKVQVVQFFSNAIDI